jgi:hypothetical protein
MSKAVLFAILSMGKMGSRVAFVLDPCRKVDKRKLDSELHTILLVVFHSLLLPHLNCNTKLIDNGKRLSSSSPTTMAMGSLQPPSLN